LDKVQVLSSPFIMSLLATRRKGVGVA
jgi:hypothetical protein